MEGESIVRRYTDVSEDAPQMVSDQCVSAETLPSGEVVQKRVRTTGHRRATTERMLICGRTDDEQFMSLPLLTDPPQAKPLPRRSGLGRLSSFVDNNN